MKKLFLLGSLLFSLCTPITELYAQSQPYLGEIRLFSGNFAPKGWAFCNGQLLSISHNQALFSLLGTTYGGDGRNNFALPNLQGRAALGYDDNYTLGQNGGAESATLIKAQIPEHTHAINAINATGDIETPSNANLLSKPTNVNSEQAHWKGVAATNAQVLAPATVGDTGNSQAMPLPIRSPYATVSFIIALQGVFPSQN